MLPQTRATLRGTVTVGGVLRSNDEIGGFDQTHQFRGAVVGGHIPGLVTRQVLAILFAGTC